MVDNKKEEFLSRIKVPEDGSPNFDEECLLQREFIDMEKNPKKYEGKTKRVEKSKINDNNNNSYYGGPFELEQFLLDLEDVGLFEDSKGNDSEDGRSM
jgi:hypothetical protein